MIAIPDDKRLRNLDGFIGRSQKSMQWLNVLRRLDYFISLNDLEPEIKRIPSPLRQYDRI